MDAASPQPGPSDAEALCAWLATRDTSCPVCTYNLRGAAAPRCPECGAPLRLLVGSDNTRIGPWLLAVLSLALALGFDGVVSILMIAGLVFSPPPSPAQFQVVEVVLACFLMLAAVTGMGIVVLLRGRRRWNRLPLRSQWRAAFALFIGVGAGHALFGWFVMSRFG